MKINYNYSKEFVKLPLWLLELDNGLSITDKVLYAVLAARVHFSTFTDDLDDRQFYFMSPVDKEELALVFNMDLSTFNRHLKTLKDYGFISVERSYRGSKVFETFEERMEVFKISNEVLNISNEVLNTLNK